MENLSLMESHFNFEKTQHHVWVNKKEKMTLSYSPDNMTVRIVFLLKHAKLAFSIAFYFKNIKWHDTAASILFDNNLVEDVGGDFQKYKETVIDAVAARRNNQELLCINVVFAHRDEYDYVAGLFIWVNSPDFEEYYLKSLEERRLKKLEQLHT